MAQDTLPLKHWRDRLISPTFWDSDPIALNLEYAFRWFPGHKDWAKGARDVVDDITASCGSTLTNLSSFPPCKHLQKDMYDKLVSTFFSCNLSDIIHTTSMVNT